MKKTIRPIIGLIIVVVFGCAVASANTLSGYALKGKHLASDPSSRWGGALVEFKDAVTKEPVKIDIVTGKKVEGRKDALYAMDAGDIGKWQVKVKSGKYIVTIGGKDVTSSYTLSLMAMPTVTCTGTGFYNFKTDFGFASNQVGNSDGDDTHEIEYAIEVIRACGGGTLYFPNGFYNVGTTYGDPSPNLFEGTTLEKLPFNLPSGIIIQGSNGATYGISWLGSSRITLKPSANLTSTTPIFKIGEIKHSITMRDITLLAVPLPTPLPSPLPSPTPTPSIPDIPLAKSTAVVAEGTAGNSSFGVLFSNMSISGFQIGINVKGCVDSDDDCAGDWQLDNAKVDHVWFKCATGMKMNTPNTDWEISNAWFTMYPKTVVNLDENNNEINRAIAILKAGWVQANSVLGGGVNETNKGGDFFYVESIGGLTIISSQMEGVTNGLVFGKVSGSGTTLAKIIAIGSEFGGYVRLRQVVNFISMGNHYGKETIQTSQHQTRIYSMGDKFCNDGLAGTTNPGEPECGSTPGVQGPATVVFSTGQLAETNSNGEGGAPVKATPEIPNKFGMRTEVKDGNVFSDKPVFSITAPDGCTSLNQAGNCNGTAFTRPLLRLGISDSLTYTFSRNHQNGFLEVLASQAPPYSGLKLNGLIQFEGVDYITLTEYNTAVPGAMVFCTDCKAGTNGACVQDTASVPEGAFAKLYSGVPWPVWKCN